jgi:hypothetical protein
MSSNRTTLVLVAALVAACGGSKKEVKAAKSSLYDTDFATIYTAAVDATRALYPNLEDSPGPGKIQTAWHPVLFGSAADDDVTGVSSGVMSQNMAAGGMGAGGMQPGGMTSGVSPAARGAGMPTRLATKKFFIRFDVSVVGGRPWKVKVVGHASEWSPGAALPVEMHGANRPTWLDPRIEQLQVAIYRKLSQFAKPMPEDTEKSPDDDLPKTDPSQFAGVPAAAAKRLAELKDTLGKRDYAGLRPQLAEDVTWSLGGGNGADAAMAMWQADPAQFEAMAAAIAAGCGPDGDTKVRCPAAAPAAGQWQLVIEPRGDAWRVTSFVKDE